MKDHLKNFLNEEQDPKAIEKITAKLNDLLMKGEEIAYIGVQKKPAITVFPDSIVLTNKRIIICKPKNLGLSMDFTDYAWEDIGGAVVKENILGSEFSFSTKSGIQVSIDYIPKSQARKIYTFSREQMEGQKGFSTTAHEAFPIQEPPKTGDSAQYFTEEPIEEVEAEEVNDFSDLLPISQSGYRDEKQHPDPEIDSETDQSKEVLAGLSNEELFQKLQNYKKLLDNGLILQSEYDALKKEILTYM